MTVNYKFVVLSAPRSPHDARFTTLDQAVVFMQLRRAHVPKKKTGRGTITPAGQPSPTGDVSRSSNRK